MGVKENTGTASFLKNYRLYCLTRVNRKKGVGEEGGKKS